MKETLQIIGKYTVPALRAGKSKPFFDVLIYEEEGKSNRLALEDRRTHRASWNGSSTRRKHGAGMTQR